MRKTNLMVNNSEVTYQALKELVSGSGPVRMGLRVAIVQGVIDNAPIDQLSRRHNISRQGIYNMVKRVNKYGMKGLDEKKRPGRRSKLTPDIREDFKDILTQPPINQGYRQSRWDGPLVRKYLKEKHGVDIGRSQVINWLHEIDFSVQRGRKKFSKADPEKQTVFVEDLKKTPKSET
ncbi:MAG TPA: helix-turn-helix domain-containing protein [Candidatus Brocadiaceae bacterium]